jgi:hypothetical protein
MNRPTLITLMLVAFIVLAGLSVAVAEFGARMFDHDMHPEYLKFDCTVCHGENMQQITPDPATCGTCHKPDFMSQVTYPGKKTHGSAWALNHGIYVKSGVRHCMACHQEYTDKARKDRNPKATTCYDCHSPSGKDGEFGPYGGSLHNVHTSDFYVTHPLAARTDPRLCTNCHTENRFCTDCHNNFNRNDLALKSHRRSWSDLTVIFNRDTAQIHEAFDETQCQACHRDENNSILIPADRWARGHAIEARKNLATCQACHPTGNTCIKCHSARTGLGVNPHPKGWKGSMSDRLDRAGKGRTCAKCH